MFVQRCAGFSWNCVPSARKTRIWPNDFVDGPRNDKALKTSLTL